VFMDARSTVTAEEGDRYPLKPPYISIHLVRIYVWMLRPVTVSGADCKSVVSGLVCSNQTASTNITDIAQQVEQQTENLCATGSIPVIGTINNLPG
jgi:hypothetical protein